MIGEMIGKTIGEMIGRSQTVASIEPIENELGDAGTGA